MPLVAAIVAASVLAWLACGALNYAATFAYFQREYTLIAERHYRSDRIFASVLGLLGPVGIPAALVGSRVVKHGLKWR